MADINLPPGIVPKPRQSGPKLPPGIIPKSQFAGAPQKAPVSPVVEQPLAKPASPVGVRPFRAPLPQRLGPALGTGSGRANHPEPLSSAEIAEGFGKNIVKGAVGTGASAVRGAALLPAAVAQKELEMYGRVAKSDPTLRWEIVQTGPNRTFMSVTDDTGTGLPFLVSPKDDLFNYIQYPSMRPQLEAKHAAIMNPGNNPGAALATRAEQAVVEALPTTAAQDRSFWAGGLPQGIGSTAAFLSAAPLGPLGIAGVGASSQADAAFRDALDSGADLQTAFRAAGWNSLGGMTESIPLTHLLGRLNRLTGGRVRDMVVQAGIQGGEEAAQETVQAIIANVTAAGLYDPDRGILDGVADNALVGAAVGALFGGTGGALAAQRQPPVNRRSLEQFLNQPPAQPEAQQDSAQPPPAPQVPQQPETAGGGSARLNEAVTTTGTPVYGAADERQKPSTSQHVGPHAAPVPGREEPGLPGLRRQGDNSVPGVDGGLLGVRVRHGPEANSEAQSGSQGQQRPVLPGQLQMGEPGGAGGQPAPDLRDTRALSGQNADIGRVGAGARPQAVDALRSDQERLAGGESAVDSALRVSQGSANDQLPGRESAPGGVGQAPRSETGDHQREIATRARVGEGTRGQVVQAGDAVDTAVAASQADTSPTPDQKRANNYAHGHVKFLGFDISIETPKGAERVDPDSKWRSPPLPAHYGYFKRSEGKDGDQVDVYLGDDLSGAEAYVIDQLDPKTGRFDEHKVVLGVPDMVSAIQTYDQSYSGGGQDRIGAVTPLSIDELKAWIKSGDTKKPLGNIAAASQAIRDKLAGQRALSAQPGAAPAVPARNQPAPSTEPVTVQPAESYGGRPLPKGIVPKTSRGRKQAWVSITGLARKMGGIKDVGGDLRAMDMLRLRPGVINNRSGMDLDKFGEALFQMPEWRDQIQSDTDPDTWDVKKVVALMGEELSGRSPTPRGEEAATEDAAAERQEEASRDQAWQAANAHTQTLLGRDLDQAEFEAILRLYVSQGYDSIEDAVTDTLESDIIADVGAREGDSRGQVQERPEEAAGRDRVQPSAEQRSERPSRAAQEDEARPRRADQDQGLPREQGAEAELTDAGPKVGDLWKYSTEEIDQLAIDVRNSDDRILAQVFGEEGAQRFRRLDRQSNSSDNERADRAYAELGKMEDALSPEKRAVFERWQRQGWGPDPESVEIVRRAHEVYGPDDSIQAIAADAAYGLTRAGAEAILNVPKGNATATDQAAYVRFMNAVQELRQRGVDADTIPQLLTDAMMRRAIEPNDAADIVGHFLKTAKGRSKGPVKTEKTAQGEQAVMPGMERSARQAAQARDEKRGGKMGSDKAQAEPGGMFEEKPDDRQTDIADLSNIEWRERGPFYQGKTVTRADGALIDWDRQWLDDWGPALEWLLKWAVDNGYSLQQARAAFPAYRRARGFFRRLGIPADIETLIDGFSTRGYEIREPGRGIAGQSDDLTGEFKAYLADGGNVVDWLGDMGQRTGFEYVAVMSEDGQAVFAATSNLEGSVTFAAPEAMFRPDSALIIHHNHPKAAALSSADLSLLAYPGVKFVIAHAYDGRGFSAAALTQEALNSQLSMMAIVDEIQNGYVEAYNALAPRVNDTLARQEYAMRALANAGLVEYHTTLFIAESDLPAVEAATFIVVRSLPDVLKPNADQRGSGALPAARLHRSATYRRPTDALEVVRQRTRDHAAAQRARSAPARLDSGRNRLENGRREGSGAENAKATLANRVTLENRTFGNPNAPNVATRAAGQQIQLDILKHLHRPGWRAGAERRLRSWREYWRDSFATAKDVESYIESKTGQRIPAHKSFYKNEEVFTGKVADQLQQFHEGILKELYDAMHDTGLSVKEIEKYLVAVHAPERNATIAAINPDMPDGGSGMTNVQAEAVIERFREQGKLQVLQRVSAAVKRVRMFDLNTRVAAGLIPARDVAQKIREWPNYVPLKGFEELFTDDELVSRPRPRIGSGYSVKNREYFQAKGRESEAVNVLANLISQAEESVVRAEKIKVAQVLADFISENPDPSFWSVDLVTTKRVIDPDTGLVRVEHTRMPSIEDEEAYVIYFKRAGELHRIWIKNERLVKNIRNMNANEIPKLVKPLQLFATIFRAVNVNANPEFVIPNAARDLQTGLVQALQHKAPGLKRKMVKYWPQAARASWAGYGGKQGPAGSWLGWYRRMARAGGKVDFFNIDEIDKLASSINGEMRRRSGKPIAHAENALRGAYRLLDRSNHAVENAVRLAAFRAMVEAGFTDAEAASVSKNITVNFNRRGEVSRWANLLWPFFNAAVQGTFTLGTAAARSGKVRAALAGLTMLGFAEGLANGLISAGGEDDEDESDFDKIPEYIRRKNIIVMNPGYPKNGGPPYWTVPIGYGLNVFWNAGREMSDIALGKKTIGEALGNVGVSAADAFIPVDVDQLTGLLPSFAQAPGEVLANRDFSGKPIYREPTETEEKANLPESSITRPGTNEVWKEMAKALNKMSGGSDYEPGLFDFHPESMEHIFKTYAGGVGSVISRTADLIKPEPGDPFELGKVPVIRKVIGYFPRSTESNRYYESRAEIQEAAGRLKAAEEAGDDEAAERFATKGERQLGLEGELKGSEKRLTALRKEAREVRKEPGMPESERKAALTDIYSEMDSETSGFNKTFYQEIERPRQMERSPVIRPMFEKKRKDVRATLEGEF